MAREITISSTLISIVTKDGEDTIRESYFKYSDVSITDINYVSSRISLRIFNSPDINFSSIDYNNDTIMGDYEDFAAFVTAFKAYALASESVDANVAAINANVSDIESSINDIRGKDFLFVSDTNPHTGLVIYGFDVCEDAVISSLVVGGNNVVTDKGISGVTLSSSYGFFPLGTIPATAITLTSGKVKLYIR